MAELKELTTNLFYLMAKALEVFWEQLLPSPLSILLDFRLMAPKFISVIHFAFPLIK